MVLIAPQQYWYPRKAYVLEVPKIALASLVMAFKGRASVSKNRAERSPLNKFRMEKGGGFGIIPNPGRASGMTAFPTDVNHKGEPELANKILLSCSSKAVLLSLKNLKKSFDFDLCDFTYCICSLRTSKCHTM